MDTEHTEIGEEIILNIDTSNMTDEQANDLLKRIKDIVYGIE
jgi:hypothetical protein